MQAIPPAADPLIQNSLARPDQQIAETKAVDAVQAKAPLPVPPRASSPAPAAIEARPFAVAQAASPAGVSQPATQPPAATATAIAPRTEAPRQSPEQATDALKPFDLAQAAAPVPIAPFARPSPPAETAPLAPQTAPSLAPSESVEAQTVPVNIPTAPDPAEAEMLKYRTRVAAELNLHKRYPEAARLARVTGVVAAEFTIGTTGKISDIAIVQPSGHAALDAAVRQLLGTLALPPPPRGPIRVAPVEFKFGG